MSDRNTVRILSLDGGGMRGYMSLVFFQKFIQQWGIEPNEIWKYFDVIAGTSIGGIMALAFSLGITPDEVEPFFTEEGQWVFTIRDAVFDVPVFSCNASTPSNRPNAAQKAAILLNGDQIYTSVKCPTGDCSVKQCEPITQKYGSSHLYNVIYSVVGTNTLQNAKTKVLIPSYKKNTESPVIFSNVNYPDFIGQNELMRNVAAATSAAPTYLPPFVIGTNTYLDGALYQNNPASLALSLGKTLKPLANRFCVLSIGTGLGDVGFDPGTPSTLDVGISSPASVILDLVKLIDIGISGNQEAIHKALYIESEYSLSQLYYYRFQTDLDPLLDTEIDNTTPEILAYYKKTAEDYYTADQSKITTFIGHLDA